MLTDRLTFTLLGAAIGACLAAMAQDQAAGAPRHTPVPAVAGERRGLRVVVVENLAAQDGAQDDSHD